MAKTLITKNVKQLTANEYALYKVLDDETAADTKSDEIEIDGVSSVAFAVKTSVAVAGGVVTLEGSPVSGDSGTWVALKALTCNTASKYFGATVTDATDVGLNACRYIRLRISTVIANGSIDAWIGITR